MTENQNEEVGNAEDFFNEYAEKAKLKEKTTPVVDDTPDVYDDEVGQDANLESNTPELTEEELAQKALEEENARKEEEEERVAKETAEKLAQEQQAVKPLSEEEIRKKAIEEYKSEEQKKEVARQELVKKEHEEKVAKENAEKLAKEIEADKNWNPESVLTAEEKEDLKLLESEYGEVSKYVKVMNKMSKATLEREIAKVRKESETQIEAQILNYHNYISTLINPVIQTQQMSQEEIARKEVFSIHPDFVEVTPQVEAWINSKPDGKLKAGLMQAFTEGDYKDVIELYNDYKKMNGVSNNNALEQAKLAEKARLEADKKAKDTLEKELADKKKKEKAQALGAVSSSNTEIDNNSSEKNEEDWFDFFSKKAKK